MGLVMGLVMGRVMGLVVGLVTGLVLTMAPATASVAVTPDHGPVHAHGRHARAALDIDIYESRVLHLVNQRRTAHGRHPVHQVSSCVDRLSEGWAAHLAGTGDFAHRDQHVVLNRCHMHWAGEALARGTAMTPSGAVRAWMHSAEHRAVLLKSRANRAGLGVRLDGQGRVVLVLNFADTRG
jgi:hypothetical protein